MRELRPLPLSRRLCLLPLSPPEKLLHFFLQTPLSWQEPEGERSSSCTHKRSASWGSTDHRKEVTVPSDFPAGVAAACPPPAPWVHLLQGGLSLPVSLAFMWPFPHEMTSLQLPPSRLVARPLEPGPSCQQGLGQWLLCPSAAGHRVGATIVLSVL